MNKEQLLNLIEKFNGYSFSTLEYASMLEIEYPHEWADLIDTYGEGGKGSGRHYTAFSRIAQYLNSLATQGILDKLDYRPAPTNWGSPIIRYWVKNELLEGEQDYPDELQEETRRLLTFNPESCGESTIQIRGPRHMSRIHGKVVNKLYNILLDEYGNRNLYNNQLIDLAVTESGNLIKIFEVKTKNDRQSIYTGIGQLMFHSGANSEVEKILLLPQSDDSYEKLYDLFDEMGIWISEYTINDDENVTFWELPD